MKSYIKKITTVFFGFLILSNSSVNAQNILGLDLIGPSTISGAVGLGTFFLSNPSELNNALELPVSLVGIISPGLGDLLEGNYDGIPQDIIEGQFLLSPNLTIVPSIPLVNSPLPGLEGL